MQGFCPPSSRRQGAGVPRPVECDARTLSKERVQKRSPRLLRISETTAEKGEYLLALSPKREYKSVALAFSVFPKQRQKEGNICSVGSLPVHAIKRHTGRLCGSKGGVLRPSFSLPRSVFCIRCLGKKNNATMQGTPMGTMQSCVFYSFS